MTARVALALSCLLTVGFASAAAQAPADGAAENSAATARPDPSIGGSKRQKLGRRVAVKVRSGRRATAYASGGLAIPAAQKVYDLSDARRTLEAGRKARIGLRIPRRARRAARRALARGRRVSANIKVAVVPGSGNPVVLTRSVSLRD